jgi:hypothetical protein
MTAINRYTCWSALTGLCLAGASSTYAQISTINSGVLDTRVYNDFPSATGNYVNNYPTSITFGESGVYRTASGGLNRDEWQFSNNGTSAYTLGASDYFSVSMDVTVSGSTSVDNEGGYLIPNANGLFGGGDLQFLADPQSGFLGMFGGTGYWNSGITYTAGTTVTMGIDYFYDAANSENAFKFWVNDGSGNVYSPVQDWSGGNLAGDELGSYYQIGNGGTSPGATGEAVFSDIVITTIPEPSALALLALGCLPLARYLRRRA